MDFGDDLIKEFSEFKEINPTNFTWWSFVNLKSDLQTALAFAKFFYPEIIQVNGCFLLKDKYNEQCFQDWRDACHDNKKCIEQMMNLYEVADFFHINTSFDEGEDIKGQIAALGDALKLFWSMSFINRFPDKNIIVEIYVEYDEQLFITVYED
ncbi:hypothetical protein [Paenibacillus glycanilyticus]|uniref:Barstar (barnase inhibitor) domain-containing protein n=1 Tax=Paenibacillus glycanilyticus TaxID=126569 RepID=A0ABQ6GFA5_9BACL|nr:hypothetical protein [Paenibacillus glycanilyticus]GLX68013.1 hypothetical protein MU1_23580 [Paenibacillus glycanilyticus]